MIYLCITPERKEKTRMIMEALAAGFELAGKEPKIITGPPPRDEHPFVVWGQAWTTELALPTAIKDNRPFWYVDNGYWDSARGTNRGYYRLTYRSMTPVLLENPLASRVKAVGVKMSPWRNNGKHVLIALPGLFFGKALGIDVHKWISEIEQRVRKATDRPVKVRPKAAGYPLSRDLAGAWAVVTHSSNAAVDAALAGVPVFVEPTSAAAPIGRTDLDIEHPAKPDRTLWLQSLMCQQFTLQEMRLLSAQKMLDQIAAQVDRAAACQ